MSPFNYKMLIGAFILCRRILILFLFFLLVITHRLSRKSTELQISLAQHFNHKCRHRLSVRSLNESGTSSGSGEKKKRSIAEAMGRATAPWEKTKDDSQNLLDMSVFICREFECCQYQFGNVLIFTYQYHQQIIYRQSNYMACILI